MVFRGIYVSVLRARFRRIGHGVDGTVDYSVSSRNLQRIRLVAACLDHRLRLLVETRGNGGIESRICTTQRFINSLVLVCVCGLASTASAAVLIDSDTTYA